MPEEDRATYTGNMHSRVWFRRYPVGQTDTQTDTLITILRNRSRGRSINNTQFTSESELAI